MRKFSLCLLSATLALAVLLSACGGTPSSSLSASQSGSASSSVTDPGSSSTSSGASSSAVDPGASSVVDPGSSSVVDPGASSVVDPVPVYTNPLTGQVTETDISGNRPVAVMLNNLKKALPHLGVSQADIIFELPVEGGITRMMALFQSIDEVGDIGTVRSARSYYVELATGWDAVYVHAGASYQAEEAIPKYGTTAINLLAGKYSGMSWRDQERREEDGLEHSLLTSGSNLASGLAKRGITLTHSSNWSSPLSFTSDAPCAQGKDAQKITVTYFGGKKTTSFLYDAASDTYLVEEFGAAYVDGNNDQQVSVTNVLVLYTDIQNTGNSSGHVAVDLIGSGSGVYACGGKYIPVTWSKTSATAPLTFSTADGQPLSLHVGTSYINVIDSDKPASIT